jgi:hypothetical protein
MAAFARHISSHRLRTPRIAAVAGILFAMLQVASLLMFRVDVPAGGWTQDALLTAARRVELAINLTPFAGIAFLWYMGVLRDRMGYFEDQFFSTLFLGSGLLYLAMTFFASGIAGGALSSIARFGDTLPEPDAYTALLSVRSEANGVYALRMAGMHMFVVATIWLRTGLMPRWLTFTTYSLAVLLLVTSSFISWITLVFPVWVGLISLYILLQNFRSRRRPASGNRLIEDADDD